MGVVAEMVEYQLMHVTTLEALFNIFAGGFKMFCLCTAQSGRLFHSEKKTTLLNIGVSLGSSMLLHAEKNNLHAEKIGFDESCSIIGLL